METTTPNWLKKRVDLSPERIALVFNNESWTFKEMYIMAVKSAGQIAGLLKKEKKRVAILLKNKPETVWIIHALQLLGIQTIFLNSRLTAGELLFQIQDSEVDLLIYDEDYSKTAHDVKGSIAELLMISVKNLFEQPIAEPDIKKEFALNELCSIMYTSGTTGKPKGVLQTYGNHWWSATGSVLNIGLEEYDSWLCTVPIFHISGFSILMRSVIYGIPVILMEKFDERTVNRLLASGQVTIMSAVSSMLSRMLKELGQGNYHPHFRCMLVGGGPVPKPLLESCKERSIPVFQTYGMTETSSQIVTLSPEDSFRKLGSAGKPLFPSQLKIVKDQKEAEANVEGEIFVKGPNVTPGYLKRKDANRDSFKNGWFSTGDLGYKDDEGYVFILDRRSDLIISGGENVYPAEIEEVLLSYELVLEAGVTAIADPKWGQVPYGFIVAEKPVSKEEIINYCRERLAPFKVPKKIIQVEQLPRNGAGKLMRRHLISLLR